MTKNKKIITCEVIEINADHILIKNNENIYACHKSQVSDYAVNLKDYFTIRRFYKFCLINEKHISYKAIRPKLIKNKRVPMPTISGVRNLEIFLNTLIKNSKTDNYKTPEVDINDVEIVKYVNSHDIDMSEINDADYSDEN